MNIVDRLRGVMGEMKTPSADQLTEALRRVAPSVDELLPLLDSPGLFPYGRKVIFATKDVEVLVMNWAQGRECSPHDHGGSFGWIRVMVGQCHHRLYKMGKHGIPVISRIQIEQEGDDYFIECGTVHSMGNLTDSLLVTLHVYSPPIDGMRVFDLKKCVSCVVSSDCGAWWPADQMQLLQLISLGADPRQAMLTEHQEWFSQMRVAGDNNSG